METFLETMSDLEKRLTIRLPIEPIERECTARVRALELRSAQPGDDIHLRDQLMQGVMHAGFLEAVSQQDLSTVGPPRFFCGGGRKRHAGFFCRFCRSARD